MTSRRTIQGMAFHEGSDSTAALKNISYRIRDTLDRALGVAWLYLSSKYVY